MVKKATISQYKYDASHVKHYHLKLNLEIDADIIEKLSSVDSMQGYIKQLVRQDIQKEMETEMESKEYRIKPEYLDRFGSDATTETVIPFSMVKRLAEGWEITMEEMQEMIYENTESNIRWYTEQK